MSYFICCVDIGSSLQSKLDHFHSPSADSQHQWTLTCLIKLKETWFSNQHLSLLMFYKLSMKKLKDFLITVGKEEGTPLYLLFRYVQLQRICFFLAVLARNRVSILNILFSNVCSPVLNGISFLEEATRRRVNSVGREPVCCAGGRGFEPQTGPTLRVLK